MQTGINNRLIVYLKCFIVLLPAIIYFFNVSTYAVNIPSNDDYQAILEFLSKYKNARGMDKFILLFSQHNEHRIFSSRVIYVLYYSLLGNINFRSIIFIANFQLLLIYYILFLFIKRSVYEYRFTASFITGLCLFDLSGWENADFAMAGMQNYGIFLWLLLSLFFYSRPGKKNLFAGILFQSIAIYSSGNGIIAGCVIALFNILSGNRTRMIISCAGILVFGPLYFVSYVSPPTGHPSMNIIKVLDYFFHLVSAHVFIDNNTLAVVAGILMLVVLVLLLPFNNKKRIPADMLPVVCFSLFLLCSMGTVSLFRSNVTGVGAYSSRYLIYPHLLVAVIFILMLYKFQNKKAIYPIAICLTLPLLAAYNMNYRWGRDCLPALKHNLQYTDYYFYDKALAKHITDEACSQKIYCIQNFRQ